MELAPNTHYSGGR